MTDFRAQIQLDLIDNFSANAREATSTMDLLEASTVDAGRTGSAAINQLDNAFEQANANARELTQSSANLARAQTQAQATTGRAGQALSTGLASGAETARRGLLGVTDAQKRQGLEMAGNINLVSELALGFGNLSPATRGLGLAFATAGNNAFALAGALGPMGVIIGTLIGVIPGVISLISNLGDEMDDVAASTDIAKQSLSEFESIANRQRAEAARRQRIELGVETVADADALLAQARSQSNSANLRFRQAEQLIDEDSRSELRRLIGLSEGEAASRIRRNASQFGLSVTDSDFSREVEQLAGAVGSVTNARRLTEEREQRLAEAERIRAEGQTEELFEVPLLEEEQARRRRRQAAGSVDTIVRARRESAGSGSPEFRRPLSGAIDIRYNGRNVGALPIEEGAESRAAFEIEAEPPP